MATGCQSRSTSHAALPDRPLVDWSATSMAKAVLTKQVSSVDLVEACLRQIAAVNPKLNAVVQTCAELALQQAKSADAAIQRGERVGVLHGVPMTIKDSFDTAGIISTGGTEGRATFIPPKDASVVARLKQAGAILLGKTNTPEFTLRVETDNLVYGRTSNPYDASRTTGGSSGGAVAIVAACGSPFDIGSDTGGSIRIPAHLCGIAGLKPTAGRTSRAGHIVPFGGHLDSWTQAGPLSRYVEDLGLVLSVIAGGDWQDPHVVDMPLGQAASVVLKGLRVAFFTDNGLDPASPEISKAVRDVAQSLAAVGATVQEERPPHFDRIDEIMGRVGLGDGGAWVQRLVQRAGTTKLSEPIEAWTTSLKPIPAAELTAGIEMMDQYRSGVLSFMQSREVILCPAESVHALPHGEMEKRRRTLTYTLPFNITGQPAAVVRAATSSEGLPIGVQIVARHWREDVALAVASHVERTFGGWQKPRI